MDTNYDEIKKKIDNNERLNFDDGVFLYNSNNIIQTGLLADKVKRNLNGDKAYYVYNQHLNYTNICKNKCRFCAFANDKDDSRSYTFSMEKIKEEILKNIKEPIKELHVVGGLNPDLDLNYFVNMLKTIKELRPNVTIKAFTAVEIDYLSVSNNLTVEETIDILKRAGLNMLPGGGAEVMSDRVHNELFPEKIGKDRWLEIIEKVHNAGIVTNATMLYGHIETIEERVNHLIQLRDLQDKTNGFSAFIPLAFHSENTKLSHIDPTTAYDDLKNISIARLMLDNFDHIKAYWVMIGEKLAQLALHFGADDLDGTIIEEKITHTAGAKSAKGLTREKMIKLIESSGLKPVERDSFYNEVI